MLATHCIKYARIRAFSDLYSPIWRQNLRLCPYTGEYRSLKTRILAYIMQWLPRLGWIFLRNLDITYSSVWIVQAIKEQDEIRVITSSFSDKERAAVLGQSAEISESEIYFPLIRIIKSKKKKLALTLFYCLGQET